MGNDNIIIDEFEGHLEKRLPIEKKNGCIFGFSWGFTQAVINLCFGVLYLVSGELHYHWPDAKELQVDTMYVAIFSVLFGAFIAGLTIAVAPDVKKAKEAGIKIYSTIDLPSKIDALAVSQITAMPVPAKFKGEIEFRDVWFRYPSRLQQWIFKGLNLKIHHNEAIGIVGESGAGKSTFISLVMRFYDPEFGTVLIDGVDIKEYNIH